MNDLNDYNEATGAGAAVEESTWVDLATGQQIPFTLTCTEEYPLDDGERVVHEYFVTPIADAGDYFLVPTGARQVDENRWEAERALILKEDYWAGKANYIPITRVE